MVLVLVRFNKDFHPSIWFSSYQP